MMMTVCCSLYQPNLDWFIVIDVLHITAIMIGFDPDTYSVNEPDSMVSLRVRLLRGIIGEGRDILVRVATADGSAQGN